MHTRSQSPPSSPAVNMFNYALIAVLALTALTGAADNITEGVTDDTTPVGTERVNVTVDLATFSTDTDASSNGTTEMNSEESTTMEMTTEDVNATSVAMVNGTTVDLGNGTTEEPAMPKPVTGSATVSVASFSAASLCLLSLLVAS